MSSKVGKRPLRSLSAHEKMDAIRRVHDGESKASVARDIGVPESTLRGWCKNEDKILYLSRQSTPETDDSEPREKKTRYENNSLTNGIHEPYNLSVKVDSPPAETKNELDSALNLTKEQPSPKLSSNNLSNTLTNNLNSSINNSLNSSLNSSLNNSINTSLNNAINTTITNSLNSAMSERERNRAELTRLSIELGLNRPEMFLPAQGSNPASLTDGLMTQWNNALAQAVNATNKVSSKLRQSLPVSQNILPTVGHQYLPKSPKPKHEKQEVAPSVDDSVWYWQQAMLGLVSQTSSQTGVDPNSSWFWKWYKQFAYTPQTSQDNTVLYQQLTKDANSENLAKPAQEKPVKSQNTKARAVLDNLLLNNNNNEVPSLSVARPEVKKDKTESEEEDLTTSEALEHGEKFLKWLECFSDPSVTAMQVLQFRYLLNNVRSCTDRKNVATDAPKMKVRRK